MALSEGVMGAGTGMEIATRMKMGIGMGTRMAMGIGMGVRVEKKSREDDAFEMRGRLYDDDIGRKKKVHGMVFRFARYHGFAIQHGLAFGSSYFLFFCTPISPFSAGVGFLG